MSELSKKLYPASFRKIPFSVESAEMDGGRRLQIHEYPQKDKPYAQDMGRSSRHIAFNAFVVGLDYVQKANALIGAIEEPGTATLVHPWLGNVKVNALSYRVSFNRELGQAVLALAFVESGDLEFPSSAQSTALLSRQAAANLKTASNSWFSKVFTTVRQINDAVTKATAIYGKVLNFLSNPIFAVASALGFGALPGNLTSIVSLLGNSALLSAFNAGLVSLSNYGASFTGDDSTLSPTVRGLTRMATGAELAQPKAKTFTTASRAQIDANEKAILAHTRQQLLLNAVELSSYLKCSVYDDTQNIKKELAKALDDESLLTDDDDLYQALLAARNAMLKDLTDRSRDSARLIDYTPDDIIPALAVAYDYYEDAGRDLEIVARNKISNPGFVPPAKLLLLSR